MDNHSLSTTFVSVVFLGLLPNLFGQAQRTSPPAHAKPKPAAAAIRQLTVDEVLDWRNSFHLNSDVDMATNPYGPPDEITDLSTGEGAPRLIHYKPKAKTNNRGLGFGAKNGKVDMVDILPASYERLDVERVLLEGQQFCFSTGVSVLLKTGLTRGEFYATSRDGTAQLILLIAEGPSSVETEFFSVTFYIPGADTPSCDRPGPGTNERRRTF
jgi:hypothetical protein